MAHRKLPNYLRTHRKRLDLTQDQVAFLLGSKGGAKICRYEQFEREPSLRTALACEVIFSRPVRELFAGIYDEVERTVSNRARILARRLNKESRGQIGKQDRSENSEPS